VTNPDAIGLGLLSDVLAGLDGVAPLAEAPQVVLAAGAAIDERQLVIDTAVRAYCARACCDVFRICPARKNKLVTDVAAKSRDAVRLMVEDLVTGVT
jgi:hypothetical protein